MLRSCPLARLVRLARSAQEGDAAHAVVVMVSNINGTDVGIIAERYRGALGHLYSPGAQRGPWPEIPYALDNLSGNNTINGTVSVTTGESPACRSRWGDDEEP